MSLYNAIDVTQKDEKYKVENEHHTIFMDDQCITLKQHAYLDTLKVWLVGSQKTTLVKNDDWIVTVEHDRAIDTMGALRTISSDINAEVVKSIQMRKNPYAGDFGIVLEYQSPFVCWSFPIVETDRHISIGPEHVKQLFDEVALLKRAYLHKGSGVANVVESNFTILQTDLTGKLDDNIIKEIHEVNTPLGQNVIRPSHGSFYINDLVVRNIETNNILINGIDYSYTDMNPGKTKEAYDAVAVYDSIILLRDTVGKLEITARAFGGGVSPVVITEVTDAIDAINRYLNNNQSITSDTLPNQPVITSLTNKLTKMEDVMRSMISEGVPQYEDATGTGMCSKFKCKTEGSDLHWFNVAELYKIMGQPQVSTNEIGRFRIETMLSKLQFEVVVAVNVKSHNNPFTVKTVIELSDDNYNPADLTQVTQQCMPQLRIVYNNNAGVLTGAYLQLGLSLPDVSIETVSIEDKSGRESCFKLVSRAPAAMLEPVGPIFNLPDGESVWSDRNVISKQDTDFVNKQTGYIASAGVAQLSDDTTHVDVFLLQNFDFSKIDYLEFKLSDQETRAYLGKVVKENELTTREGLAPLKGNANLFIRVAKAATRSDLDLLAPNLPDTYIDKLLLIVQLQTLDSTYRPILNATKFFRHA